MSWEIEIERKALKQLKKIPEPYKSVIIDAIDSLSTDPRPNGCTKLKGSIGLWRIRVNAYRIVYQVQDHQLLVLVIRINHRSDVYKGL